MPDRQLLHLVIGGELKDVAGVEFRDLSKIDLVGAYPSYDDAFAAWRARAQATVDNALCAISSSTPTACSTRRGETHDEHGH